MARIARIVIPNHTHHIIQRGNHCEKVFFSEDDKQAYLCLLTKQVKESGTPKGKIIKCSVPGITLLDNSGGVVYTLSVATFVAT